MISKQNLKKLKKILLDCILILIGTAIYAFSISTILNPNNLAPGGISGISIMINYLTSIPTGVLLFCLNIPILLLGLWQLGVRFSAFTLVTVAICSEFIDLFSLIDPVTDNKILAGMIGGALMAIGIGLVFKGGSTTGGTDVIVRIIRKKYKHLRSGKVFLCIDCVIVGLSAVVYKDIETALYAFIALYISSIVLDKVLYGADGAKMVYIVTDKPQEISDIILKKLDLGVTFLKGEGAYSGKKKEVIMCVMRKSLLPKVREIVNDADNRSFMIVTPATEIFGEGFKEYDAEEL